MRRFRLVVVPALLIGMLWFGGSALAEREDELETWYCDTARFIDTNLHYDAAVRTGRDNRTWFWDPYVLGPTQWVLEPYEVESESLAGKRFVHYYEKGRMECDPPREGTSRTPAVTFGLLATELMTGNLQLGDMTFDQREPSNITVAGDPDNPDVPTYAAMGGVMHYEPIPEGWTLIQTIDPNGALSHDERFAAHGAFAEYLIPETNHRIASPFWEFMNSKYQSYSPRFLYRTASMSDVWYEIIGFPITEAYWTTAKVAGEDRDVLIQCFERRCLTYTPDNPDGWQVEMGNISMHYYQWRYPEGHE